ncbi:hypothetical protein THAOC_36850, partial [Thalassiosira oceanica]
MIAWTPQQSVADEAKFGGGAEVEAASAVATKRSPRILRPAGLSPSAAGGLARGSNATISTRRSGPADAADPPRAKSPPERKKPPQKPRARSRIIADGGPSLLEGVDTSTLTRHLKCLLPPDRLRALSSEGDGDCASVADAPSRLRTRPYSTRPGDGVLITHGEADAAGLGGRGLKALGFALRNYGRPAGGGSGGGGSERSELADLRITDSGVVGEDGHENGNENENDDEDVDGRRAGLWVCAGLEHNTSIKRLTLHGLGLGPAELAVLGRFVSGNPSLRILALRGCLGRADGHPSRGTGPGGRRRPPLAGGPAEP